MHPTHIFHFSISSPLVLPIISVYSHIHPMTENRREEGITWLPAESNSKL
jgi:hypothetical protein